MVVRLSNESLNSPSMASGRIDTIMRREDRHGALLLESATPNHGNMAPIADGAASVAHHERIAVTLGDAKVPRNRLEVEVAATD